MSENSIGSDSYQLELKKADSPKLVRLLEFESIGVTGAELNFERDYSEGQIDIESVIVKLEAINRPLKGKKVTHLIRTTKQSFMQCFASMSMAAQVFR